MVFDPFRIAQQAQSAASNRAQLAQMAQDRQFQMEDRPGVQQRRAAELAALEQQNAYAAQANPLSLQRTQQQIAAADQSSKWAQEDRPGVRALNQLALQGKQRDSDKELQDEAVKLGASISMQTRNNPEQAPQIYADALAMGKRLGMPVDKLPQQYGPEAQNALDTMYAMVNDQRSTQMSADERFFNSLTSDLSPEEKDRARRIKLRMEAGAVGDATSTALQQGIIDEYAGAKGTVAGRVSDESSQAKLANELELKPQIAREVAQAQSDVKTEAEARLKKAENTKQYAMYKSSTNALSDAYSKLSTAEWGPVAGNLPAATAEAQAFDSNQALVFPQIRAVFRIAGEGSSSDQESAALKAMIPTRALKPAVFKRQQELLDRTIQAKLMGDYDLYSELLGVKVEPPTPEEREKSMQEEKQPVVQDGVTAFEDI